MSTDAPKPDYQPEPRRGLPIAWPVLFFVTGDRGHLPAPGIVFKNQGNGVLDIVEFRFGADQKIRTGVRHLTDPFLKENDANRVRNGAWDFVPGLVPPPDLPIFPSGMNPSTEEIQVLTMAAQGATRGQIAEATGLKPGKVAELIDRYQNCLP